MALPRNKVDLDIALNEPARARRYIEDFDWGLCRPPEYLVFGIDEKVYLHNLNDQDAVRAAKAILNDIDKQQAWRESKFEYWHH